MKLSTASHHANRFEAQQSQYNLSVGEQHMRSLEFQVASLIDRTMTGDFWYEGFTEVSKLLKAVPLTTLDFSTALRHLTNSVDYCHLEEFGAAAFELRVVRGILQRL